MKKRTLRTLILSGAALIVGFILTLQINGNGGLSFQTYSGGSTPIDVNDRQFFTNPNGDFPQENIWGWSNYEYARSEALRHQGKVIFQTQTDPSGRQYYRTTSGGNDATIYNGTLLRDAVVHCPAGATVSGPYKNHIYSSPTVDGVYDARNHYSCELNGVGVDPLPGPEPGTSMPDQQLSGVSKMTKETVDGVDYYKFAGVSSYRDEHRNLAENNGGYVACSYSVSGPYGDDNHYYCLSQDGSRQVDVLFGGQTMMVAGPRPPTYDYTFWVSATAGATGKEQNEPVRTIMTLKNEGNVDATYALSCTNDQSLPASYKTFNPISDLPSVSPTLALAAGQSKEWSYNVAIGTATESQATIRTNCSVYNTARPETVKSVADTGTVTGFSSGATTNATLTLNPKFVGQYNNTKFGLTVRDPDGMTSFSVKKANGSSIYSGTPPGCMTSNTSGTVTLSASDGPLSLTVTDCLGTTSSVTVTIPATAGQSTTGPAPTPNSRITLNQLLPGQYNNTKFNIQLHDPEGVQEFSVNKSSGESVYSGYTGAACVFTLTSSNLTLVAGDGPLTATITDCAGNVVTLTATVPATAGVVEGSVDTTTTTQSSTTTGSETTPTLPTTTTTTTEPETGSPEGARACPVDSQNCVEPGQYRSLNSSDNNGFWCGGPASMTYYSASQVYCPPASANSTTSRMWTGSEVKAVLDSLGSGWGLCRPTDSNCMEPGEQGTYNGWCAWLPPSDTGPMPFYDPSTPRTCPGLDEVYPTQQTQPGEVRPSAPDSVLPSGPAPLATMRECAAGEIPTHLSACQIPMYRWQIAEKRWEKCSAPSTTSPGAFGPREGYTSCQSMMYDLEKDWRTERYLVRPPETFGEWYEPSWDATKSLHRYSPETDDFVACDASDTLPVPAATGFASGEPLSYRAPCVQVPEKDRGWMLKRYRSENAMYKRYDQTVRAAPEALSRQRPEQTQATLPTTTRPALTSLEGEQCRSYLVTLRQGLLSDKQFWKDMSNQFAGAPAGYPGGDHIQDLLDQSYERIVTLDRLARKGECSDGTLETIFESRGTLHSELFSELSVVLPDVQDYGAFSSCQARLGDRSKQLELLIGGVADEDKKAQLESLKDELDAQLEDFDERSDEFSYDLIGECQSYYRQTQHTIAPLLIYADEDINRIIDEVVNSNLGAAGARLRSQLEAQGKEIEALLVQVAELHKSLERISAAAETLSSQITISYGAFSRIDSRFEKEKNEIQASKDELIPLIEQTATLIDSANCVRGENRNRVLGNLARAGAINWISDRGVEIARRLDAFASTCKAKSVVKSDIDALEQIVGELADLNQEDSWKEGMMPFEDVPTHEWYYGPMLTASANGFLTQGRPAESVLRQDALLMIVRAAGATDAEIIGDCSGFPTAVTEVSPYARCGVKAGLDRGLSLSGSMLTPITRVEVAAWLAQLKTLSSENGSALESYSDLADLTVTEREAVAAVVSGNYMVGNVSSTGASFKPRDSLTRAALAVILEKFVVVPQ